MKSLISIFLLSMIGYYSDLSVSETTDQSLNLQLESELTFEQKVWIYGYDGQLIRELSLSDVASNKISIMDHLILNESDFAFDHQGDFYYFGSKTDLKDLVPDL